MRVDDTIGKANVPVVALFLSESFPSLLFAYIEILLESSAEQNDEIWSTVFRTLLQDKPSGEVEMCKNLFPSKAPSCGAYF